jgi:hypothetical protein
MLLHATHNSLLLLMQTYVKELSELGLNTDAERHIPLTWMVGAASAVILATGMMIAGTRHRQQSPQPN